MENLTTIEIIETLKKKSYNISFREEKSHTVVLINGRGIIGAFCDNTNNSNDCHFAINNTICFDYSKRFDKIQKCRYQFPLPKRKEELNYILSRMEIFGTKKGRRFYNLEEIKETVYPRLKYLKKTQKINLLITNENNTPNLKKMNKLKLTEKERDDIRLLIEKEAEKYNDEPHV